MNLQVPCKIDELLAQKSQDEIENDELMVHNRKVKGKITSYWREERKVWAKVATSKKNDKLQTQKIERSGRE